jgi:hypothetical protein
MRSARKRRYIGWIILLQLLPVAWFCRDFIFRGELLISPEVADMTLPWANHLHDIGWDFHSALWDRTSFCGVPFLANPAARTFYPPEMFFRLLTPLSPESTFGWLIFLHMWLLGIGGALWARGFVHSMPGYQLSGWIWAANGYVIARTGMAEPGFLFSIAWMPWILLFLTRLDHPLAAPCLCLVGVFQVLAGRPDLTVYFGYVVAGLLLWTWAPRCLNGVGRSRALRAVAGISLAAVIIFLVTAIQTLPAAEFQKYSVNRSGEARYERATNDSSAPSLFLLSLIPKSLGDPTDPNRDYMVGFPGTFWGEGAGYHEVYFYLGQCTLLLVVLGLIGTKSRLKWYWLLVIVLSLLLAMGKHSPLYYWAFKILPGWDRFRVPPRILVALLPGVAFLAAQGLDLVLSGRLKPIVRSVILGFLALWVVAAICGFQSGRWVEDQSYSVLGALSPRHSEKVAQIVEQRIADFKVAVLFAAAMAFVSSLLAFLALELRRSSTRILALLLPAVILADLCWTNGNYIRGMTREQLAHELPTDPLIDRYRKDCSDGRLLVLGTALGVGKRLVHPWFFPGRLFNYGVESPCGYGPFLLADYVHTFERIDPSDPAYNGGLLLYLFSMDHIDRRLFSLFQVSAVISPDTPVRGFQTLMHYDYVGETKEVSRLFLCRNPDITPRAFLYRQEPGETIPVLDKDLGAAELKATHPTEVAISVDAAEPCRLMLLETWYPGWTCEVNGVNAAIAKTAGTFRSVEVPKGHSEVAFEYLPRSWSWGCGFSVSGLALVFLVFLRRRLSHNAAYSCGLVHYYMYYYIHYRRKTFHSNE